MRLERITPDSSPSTGAVSVATKPVFRLWQIPGGSCRRRYDISHPKYAAPQELVQIPLIFYNRGVQCSARLNQEEIWAQVKCFS